MSENHPLISVLDDARDFLLKRCPHFPKIVVVLGSGLCELLTEMDVEQVIPYSEIPHVRGATVQGHKGQLLVGKLQGTSVACMQGRLHYYEGNSFYDVVFPFRALAWAGAEVFLLTNAAGGLTKDTKPASLMLIRDHINLMGGNPLRGPNEEKLGERFPDMTRLYDPELRSILEKSAAKNKIPLPSGVYVALHGPSFETPTEVRMYKMLGGDVAGMSTVPEAIALHHMGKRVAAVSCVTNFGAGVTGEALNHDEVLDNAKLAYRDFSLLIKDFVKEVGIGFHASH